MFDSWSNIFIDEGLPSSQQKTPFRTFYHLKNVNPDQFSHNHVSTVIILHKNLQDLLEFCRISKDESIRWGVLCMQSCDQATVNENIKMCKSDCQVARKCLWPCLCLSCKASEEVNKCPHIPYPTSWPKQKAVQAKRFSDMNGCINTWPGNIKKLMFYSSNPRNSSTINVKLNF